MRTTAILMLGCTIGLPALAGGPDPELDTRQRMQPIFEAVRFLFPLSLQEERFRDPELRDRILASLQLLQRSSGDLASHGQERGASFAFLSRSLSIDVRDVNQRYEEGHVREARFLVQQLVETCVACHSRLPSEQSSGLSSQFASELKEADLPLDERAKLEYATRQFDRAVVTYEQLLASPDFSPTTLDLMGHLDDYLELSIRVRGEYERPALALESFSGRDEISPALAGEVKHWIRSLRELEKRKPAPDPLVEARLLMEDAGDTQRFRDERDALVYYLQAGSVLHRYLEGQPTNPNDLASAYYMLGTIETRVGQSFWLSQAEVFLESAIRTAPSSDVALRSYDLLEEFLVAGYTGSSGVQVPPDIQAKLDELRRIVDEARAGA